MEDYMKLLRERMKPYYNIHENYILKNNKYDMYAEFIVKNEKYLLSKNVATLYSVSNYDYCFIKIIKSDFSIKDFDEILENFTSNINSIVKPSENHMSSNINIVLVSSSSFEKAVIAAAEKYRFYKSFLLGLMGWCHIGIVLVDLNSSRVFCNKKGKEVQRTFMPESYN